PGSPVSSPRDSAVSSGCRCHADPHQRHGPYYQWTAKIDGKTVTRWLKSAAALYQQWIDNDRLLSGLINQMRDIAGHATVSSSKTPTPRPARLNAS
ncbi:MAG: DUF6788 family protein, partial [Acidimicrobiales bacterium]